MHFWNNYQASLVLFVAVGLFCFSFNIKIYAFSFKNSAVSLKTEVMCKPRAAQRYSVLFTYTVPFNCAPTLLAWIWIINTLKPSKPTVLPWIYTFSLLHPTKLEHFVYVHSEIDKIQLADTILKYRSDWRLSKITCYCFQKSFHTRLLTEDCNIKRLERFGAFWKEKTFCNFSFHNFNIVFTGFTIVL